MAHLTVSTSCLSVQPNARTKAATKLSSRACTFIQTRVSVNTPVATRSSKHRAERLEVVSYRETEKFGDWRVKQMVDLCHTYFADFITKGKVELANEILDEDVVHIDIVWDASHPIAGVKGMKTYVSALRHAYPDFWVEIDQIGTCDVNSVFVTYEGSATNLGEYHSHKPSRHTSNFQGCNLIKFNNDRSKITEIKVYRSAFAEDKLELGEKEHEGNFREIRLRRLI